MVFFVLSSVGLPGLNGFIGEFLCLIGTFVASPDAADYPGVLGPWYAAFAASGMIFAAMYLLMMTGKVVWGPLKEPRPGGHAHGEHGAASSRLPPDLTLREVGVLTPLAVACLVIGFQPSIIMDTLESPIENILVNYPAQVQRSQMVGVVYQGDPKSESTSALAAGRPGALDEQGGRSDG
jgi:NADH-quinone oxidoreductase subunit M